MPTTYFNDYPGTVPQNPNPAFTLNPAPQTGVQDPYGMVPGPIGLPNPAGDLGAQYPNLGATNAQLSSNILDKLSGTLAPSTIASIQRQYGGQGGVMSGMPGSGLSWNSVYGNIIGASEAQRQQGIQAYNQTMPTIKGTQTVSPELQTHIAELNAINASAPNPAMAQTYAQQLFDDYMRSMANRGPAGGTYGFNRPTMPADSGILPGATADRPNYTGPRGFPDPTTTVPTTGVPSGMSTAEADAWYAMGIDPYSLGGMGGTGTMGTAPYTGPSMADAWTSGPSGVFSDYGNYSDVPMDMISTTESSFYDPFSEFGFGG